MKQKIINRSISLDQGLKDIEELKSIGKEYLGKVERALDSTYDIKEMKTRDLNGEWMYRIRIRRGMKFGGDVWLKCPAGKRDKIKVLLCEGNKVSMILILTILAPIVITGALFGISNKVTVFGRYEAYIFGLIALVPGLLLYGLVKKIIMGSAVEENMKLRERLSSLFD